MKRDARASAYVCAAALGAELVSLRAGWVLDDWELLVENPYLRSTGGLASVLTKELFVASGDPRHFPYYRPVSGLVYWLTYQVFGASAVLHHAFNVALHALASVLFFRLARRLKLSPRTAIVAGVVFAVHPVAVEAVAYAGGRQDVLGWVLTFATMLLLVRSEERRARAFVIAFAGTLLASLTRELFLVAPVLHAIVAASSGEAAVSGASVRRARQAAAAGAGGALAAGAVLLLRRALHITSFDADLSPGRLLGASAAVSLRLTKDVVAPTDLAADVTVFPLSAAAAVGVVLGAAAAFVLAFVAVKRRAPALRFAFVLGGAMLAVLAASHGAVALRFGIISDRYAYGAVAAILLAIAPAIEGAVARIDPAKRAMFAFAVVAIAVAIVPLSWARAADYKSDETLTIAMIRERPDDPRSLLAQIVGLRAGGRSAEAYPLCRRYAELLPDDVVVNACLAEEAMDAKDEARAVKLLEPWLRAQPNDERARAMYFDALFRIGDLDAVKRAVERFEALAPNAPDVRAAREALARREGRNEGRNEGR